jgi:ABC-type multidrug transport system ATPase subunit
LSDPLRLEKVTVQRGSALAVNRVSLSVPRGAVYALLGQRGAGKKPVVDCILGREEPSDGRVLIFGEDAWRKRRRLAGRIARHPEELVGDRELLVLREPGETPRIPIGATAFIAAGSTPSVEEVASHVGILKQGRLILDASVGELDRGLRRIRYVNRMTETRTDFGTELDEFHAVSVKVRGWGIEAIVSDYDPEAFTRFKALDGVEDASIETMTLAEAFEVLG